MERLTDFVLHHRKRVMLAWLVIFVCGIVASGQVGKRLTTDFSLPGQPGFETDQQIAHLYGNGGFMAPLIVAVTADDVAGKADAVHAVVQSAADAAEKVEPPLDKSIGRPSYGVFGPVATRVVDLVTTGGDKALVTADGRTTYALVQVPVTTGFAGGFQDTFEPALEKAAEGTGLKVELTGYNLLALDDSSSEEAGPSLLIEVALGGLGALAVLAFVFASFLALVPILVAAVSILTTFIILLGLTYVADVSFIVQFLVAFIGLGVGIDYSLLLVTRWREERAHGRSNEDAVREATRTAGHAVISSGITVAISLMALIVLPVPFLRSIGYGGMLIPLVSTIVVLTLLPALLGGIGPRVDWPRIRHEDTASKSWSRWTRGVTRHRGLAATVAGGLLIALCLPLAGLQIGQARTEALTDSGPAYDAMERLKAGGITTGITTPIDVLVKADAPVDQVLAKVKAVQGISYAVAPDSADWAVKGTRVITAVPVRETVDNNSTGVVDDVVSALDGVPGVIGVAGQGALITDYADAVFSNFPFVLLLISLVTFVLLARTFRSLLLPLKAVLLNLLSVAATFGAAVLFWQKGYGSDEVFGIESTGAITFWLPLTIFAFLYGLSMDYEVFILARTREEYDRLGRTDDAVVEGLGRTGRLVTCAALILFLSFVALASSPGTDIKVFATALGVGILLDATVVRALLVPALVSLLGKYNWWLPDWAAKVLRVEPSPLVTEPAAAVADPEPVSV